MRKIVALFLVMLSLGLVGVAGWYGRDIPFTQQWPVFEALRTTASIIFAVVGAWLAIIYPERLKISVAGGAKKSERHSNMKLLLTPAVHSTILLVILLLIGVLAPIAKQIQFLMNYLTWCRGVSYGMAAFLTIWQAVIVVMTVFPIEMVQTQLAEEDAREELDQQYDSWNGD